MQVLQAEERVRSYAVAPLPQDEIEAIEMIDARPSS